MRITDIRTVNVCVPLSAFGKYEPVTLWYGTRYAAVKTIVFVDTDEGITGVGESSLESGEAAFRGLKRWIVGQDPFDVNAIERRIVNQGNVLHALGVMRPGMFGVVGSLDMALWDIIGKAVGKPIYKLIGGKYREWVECRYWVSDKDPKGQAEEARKAVEAGFKAIKLKAGLNPEHDVACVKAVREVVGPRIDIGWDFNAGYTAGDAILTIRKMEQYDLSHIEEPVPSSNVRALARVRAHVDVPILCCGTGCSTKESIQELVFHGAVDAVNLDITRNGGFLEAQRCAAVAEAGGLKASCHSSPGELGIATAAQLHLATATPNFLEPVDSAYTKMLPPSEDIITEQFVYHDGALKAPDGPGLGVEIDEDKLQRAKLRYETELEKWQHVTGPDPRVPSRQFYYWFNYPEKAEWAATKWPHRENP